MVLLFLPVGGPLLALLPKAVLGGLVACAVKPLLKPAESLLISGARMATFRGARDIFLGWFTFVMTVGSSPKLEMGLEAGLAMALGLAALQAGF